MTDTQAYGTWNSPVSAEMTVAGAIRFGNICIDGQDTYWLEGRPDEGGRSVLVKQGQGGAITDMTPAPYNVRTRVHEYGGGSFTVSGGTVYFINFADQRVYVLDSSTAEPRALTDEGIRFADLQVTDFGLVAVAERGHGEGEPENLLALISLESGDVTDLTTGHDFFASPVVCPASNRIAWLTWDHPDMPWDATELWCGLLNKDGITDISKVAGGDEESVFQPAWSPNAELFYVSDRSGWWNIYRHTQDGPHSIAPRDAEFGLPQWVFQMSTWAFAEDDILCTYTADGVSKLAMFSAETGTLADLNVPYSGFDQIRANDKFGVFLAGSKTAPSALVKVDFATYDVQVLRQSSSVELDASYISEAQPITFPVADNETAYGYYYPPVNPDVSAPEGAVPPLIVKSHGGPTAATSPVFSLKIQYWTTRGFAVLDVNYRGSTGYGRAYRDKLKGNWGIADVEDCVAGAQYLVDKGLADPDKLAITGGSAGGYTTLAALAFKDVFSAGASYYGVSELEILAKDTHKFESRYLDSMVGPYPERRDLYVERSPINHIEGLSCPVIFFQGLEDEIVPPNQAQLMADALRKKGVYVEHVEYEGEQHGFRKSENIITSLTRELAFYQKVFGLGG